MGEKFHDSSSKFQDPRSKFERTNGGKAHDSEIFDTFRHLRIRAIVACDFLSWILELGSWN